MSIITVEEAAELLHLTSGTVQHLMRKEGLPYSRLGERIRVIDREELERWLEERKVNEVQR